MDDREQYCIKVLGAALKDKTALQKLVSEFEYQNFPKDYRGLAKIVYELAGRKRITVTKDVLDDHLKAISAKADEIISVERAFSSCSSAKVEAGEETYFIDALKKSHADAVIRGVLRGVDVDGEPIKDRNGKEMKSVTDLLVDDKDPYAAKDLLKKAIVEVDNMEQSDPIIRVNGKDRYKEKIAEYERRKTDKSQAVGLLTGFGPLDDMTRGIQPGEMFLFAGRPGTGKSICLVNIMKNMYAQQKKNILLFSLEMPYDQYEDRFMSSYARLDSQRMLLGALTEEEEFKLKNSWEEIGNRENDFTIVDFPRMNAISIESELNRALDRYQPDAVIIDYLGIMKPNDKNAVADWEAQGRVAEEVRAVGRVNRVPIISAVQLNRSKDKTADTDRLSRSDIIAQTADCIVMINDKKKDDQDLSDLQKYTVIKNRKGESQFEFEMYKDFSKVLIENVPNYTSRLETLLEVA